MQNQTAGHRYQINFFLICSVNVTLAIVVFNGCWAPRAMCRRVRTSSIHQAVNEDELMRFVKDKWKAIAKNSIVSRQIWWECFEDNSNFSIMDKVIQYSKQDVLLLNNVPVLFPFLFLSRISYHTSLVGFLHSISLPSTLPMLDFFIICFTFHFLFQQRLRKKI